MPCRNLFGPGDNFYDLFGVCHYSWGMQPPVYLHFLLHSRQIWAQATISSGVHTCFKLSMHVTSPLWLGILAQWYSALIRKDRDMTSVRASISNYHTGRPRNRFRVCCRQAAKCLLQAGCQMFVALLAIGLSLKFIPSTSGTWLAWYACALTLSAACATCCQFRGERGMTHQSLLHAGTSW